MAEEARERQAEEARRLAEEELFDAELSEESLDVQDVQRRQIEDDLEAPVIEEPGSSTTAELERKRLAEQWNEMPGFKRPPKGKAKRPRGIGNSRKSASVTTSKGRSRNRITQIDMERIMGGTTQGQIGSENTSQNETHLQAGEINNEGREQSHLRDNTTPGSEPEPNTAPKNVRIEFKVRQGDSWKVVHSLLADSSISWEVTRVAIKCI